MRRFAFLFVLLLCCGAAQALTFPTLSGRVVDTAHVISDRGRATLERTLENFETTTGTQVVVATVPSLQGVGVEEYGYQLGRAWGIGLKGKNNGALLVVAPTERRVRIEVGYGLEGVLTDAMSSLIIQSVILPEFRAGQMEAGIIKGTDAILMVLNGKASNIKTVSAATKRASDSLLSNLLLCFLVVVFIVFRLFLSINGGLWGLLSGRGSHSGGGFGGGFSGGGGSFGGGGASGGW